MSAFIVNLSNIFDFDISMPVVSSLIAEKKIWIPKENGTFPINPSENIVCRKLLEFCNKHENLRITPDVGKPQQTSYLFLILGYESWDFLPYGRLNIYPYFKIRYILSKLSEFLNKSQDSFPFSIRIFLTEHTDSQWQILCNALEENGFTPSRNPYWFSSESIDQEITVNTEKGKLFCIKKNAKDQINDDIKAEINGYFGQFAQKLELYANELFLPRETLDTWKKSFEDKLQAITTIEDFTKLIESPNDMLKKHLAEEISIKANLGNLPPVYKYTIDTKNMSNGLRCKFEYTLFIIQFVIDPLIEEKKKIYQINNIIINEKELVPLLEKLSGIIQRYKKETVDQEKIEDFYEYSVKDSFYKNLPEITAEDKKDFNNLRFLINEIGWFYNRNKKDELRRAFDKNTYSELENKIIPTRSTHFSTLLREALNEQPQTLKIKEISDRIQKIQNKKMASPINFEHYAKKRDSLLQTQNDKFEELLKSISRLPFFLNFSLGIAFAFACMLLFSWPVFNWKNGFNAISFIPVFLLVIGIAAGISLYKSRKKILELIRELEESRAALTNNLSHHCENIKLTAKQMAEAFAQRETLKGLKRLQKKYDEQSYRILAYNNFHNINEHNLQLLCKIYGFTLQPSDKSIQNMTFNKHPEDDINLIIEFPFSDVEIVLNQQVNNKKGVRTLLKKFEVKSN